MAPKKNCKPMQKIIVEKSTQDLKVPPKSIREEEQKDSEEEKTQEDHNDHESEEEQPPTILFTPKQLEVLLKMIRPDFSELVVALKGGLSKGAGFQPANLGILTGSKIERLWIFGLRRWRITFLPPRLGSIHPWNLPNPI